MKRGNFSYFSPSLKNAEGQARRDHDQPHNLPRARGHLSDQEIDAEMQRLLDAVRGAQKDQPGEKKYRRFQCPKDVVVENVSGDDIRESDYRHQPEDYGDQGFFESVDPSSRRAPVMRWHAVRPPEIFFRRL